MNRNRLPQAQENLGSGFAAIYRRSPWCRRIYLLILAAGWFMVPPSLRAQEGKPSEYQIKAVYLYNFGKFIQWPKTEVSNSPGSFFICVLGQDPFGVNLDSTIAGESLEGKNLVARRISKLEELPVCRILFISASESSQLKKILAVLEGTPVLTVSDMPEFTLRGGMIQFVLRENKVRFEVNLTAAEKSGLVFSSQLLKVATEVRKIPPPGARNP